VSLCDWCRRRLPVDPAGEDLEAHQRVCPEYLAWRLHPDQGVLREYWIVVGDFHKLHVTRVLGRPALPVDHYERRLGWDEAPCAKWMTVEPEDLLVLVAPTDARERFQSYGPLNRPEGFAFNTLEGARARALRIVAHYEATAATARGNVEGPPTVRKYTKALEAKLLRPEAA
jgi:hypothetical protein